MLALLLVILALAAAAVAGYNLGAGRNDPTPGPETAEARNAAVVLVAGALLSAACGVFAASTGFSFGFSADGR